MYINFNDFKKHIDEKLDSSPKVQKTDKKPKYTIHFKGGAYSGFSSTSKQKMIDKCDSIDRYAEVCEEYIAPSPFNANKLTKHGKKIYDNGK